MLFDSTAYVLFLALVVLLYWRLEFRKQNYLLDGSHLNPKGASLFTGRLGPALIQSLRHG
jgi:hypothetical protein